MIEAQRLAPFTNQLAQCYVHTYKRTHLLRVIQLPHAVGACYWLAAARGAPRLAPCLSHGGVWFPALDARCQLRHELQKYVPVGHLRSRGADLRAMARIAEIAVQRLAERIFEQSDMSIPST